MSNEYSIERFRDSDGELIAYAWPGGYQVVYYTKDGSELCPECAQKFDKEIRRLEPLYNRAYDANETGTGSSNDEVRELEDELYWAKDAAATQADIYYEGPNVFCCECNAEIESAYGDPDAPSAEEIEQEIKRDYEGYRLVFFDVNVPSDCETDKARRYDLAVMQGKEEAEDYVMPAEWRLIEDDGENLRIVRISN